MRIGAIDTPADLLELSPDLQPVTIDWLWVGIRAKEGTTPAPAGLRSSAQVTVRAWWDERLLQGRYLQADGRLLHIDNVRDLLGSQVEVQISATELVGAPAMYTPQGGTAIACRAFLQYEAPVLGEIGQVVDYKTRAEVALIEVGRPQQGDTLQVGARSFVVIDYADESDDGVIRGLWLEAV
ncbi:MAG: hypothetical protein V7756_04860 [Halopseudomonas sp.]|uniref:head-tail joining protein n=1 Tax=Halopseudomonas sp. TaxID=2901191 RepID=UPI0030011AC0